MQPSALKETEGEVSLQLLLCAAVPCLLSILFIELRGLSAVNPKP